jgi:hypothetical protein
VGAHVVVVEIRGSDSSRLLHPEVMWAKRSCQCKTKGCRFASLGRRT